MHFSGGSLRISLKSSFPVQVQLTPSTFFHNEAQCIVHFVIPHGRSYCYFSYCPSTSQCAARRSAPARASPSAPEQSHRSQPLGPKASQPLAPITMKTFPSMLSRREPHIQKARTGQEHFSITHLLDKRSSPWQPVRLH
jgi:hypothetical protein